MSFQIAHRAMRITALEQTIECFANAVYQNAPFAKVIYLT